MQGQNKIEEKSIKNNNGLEKKFLQEAKILTVFGVKGGIGKSITTLNLAAACELKKKKVLILDLDLYGGSIAIALNKKINKDVFDFTDDVNNHKFNDIKKYVTNYNEYISFIACPKDPRKANKITSNYIEILIDKAKYYYDLIIIDTTHILDAINLSILELSTSILFMVTNDLFDLKNMKTLISIFKDLEITKYKVLLNESMNNNQNYYDLKSIKEILKNNIDYRLTNKHYIQNIDKYIYNADMMEQSKKTIDFKIFDLIIEDSLKDIVKGDKDE